MFRHFSVCVLSIALILSLTSPAYALEANSPITAIDSKVSDIITSKINVLNEDITVMHVKTLLDFAGNTYKLVECNPIGYFILHVESGTIVEYSTKARSPYIGFSEKIYYAGPTYYYVAENDNFTHTIFEEILSSESIETAMSISAQSHFELLQNKNIAVTNYISGTHDGLSTDVNSYNSASNTDYWVNTPSWFRNRTSFGYVSGGYCGYIAANLILKYHNSEGNISLPIEYSAPTSSTTLTQTLIDYGTSASTTAVSMTAILNTFCRNTDIPAVADSVLGINGVVSEIRDYERPCILFGNMEDAGAHAIVAYGWNEYENPGWDTFICHYGWSGSSWTEVHVYGGTSIYGTSLLYRIS